MKFTRFSSEVELVRWWKTLVPGYRLTLSDGDAAHLLEGGRPNRHDGPDIKKASLLMDGELRKGDVECHLHERDWYSHGHHLDSRYNHVLLHVVAIEGDRRAVTEDGNRVAALVAVGDRTARSSPDTCRLKGRVPREQLMDGIVPLAYGRWLQRVNILREAIRACVEPDQAFYIHSFWALGLLGNERPFGRLAQEVSLSRLRSLTTHEEVAAALLGCGGVLENSKGLSGSKSDNLRPTWSRLSRHGKFGPVVESSQWVRRGLRPHAYPERRILFGARLVRALIQGWEPWQSHFEASLDGLKTEFSTSALPGRGWCGEWLGNVILPFQEAWSQVQNGPGDVSLFSRWFDIDLGYAYGQLRRRFGSHVSRNDITNFGVQQGLLALEDRYCKLDLCQVCPLRR